LAFGTFSLNSCDVFQNGDEIGAANLGAECAELPAFLVQDSRVRKVQGSKGSMLVFG
jgi:hypothetical protein